MAQPVVRDLQSTIAELSAANKPTLDILNQSEQNLDQSSKDQIAGLDAKKTTAFDDITAQANGRGALFSGFTPDAEAKYTADSYLPALASLQQAITNSRTEIQKQKAALTSDTYNKAFGLVEGDKDKVFSWQNQQDAFAEQEKQAQLDMEFKSKQAEIDREFQRTQNAEKYRQDTETLKQQQVFAAQQSALDRSAAAYNASAKAADKAPTKNEILTSLQSDIKSGIDEIMNKNIGSGSSEVLLQKLQNAYPEVSPDEISKRLYLYRQPLESKYNF